MTCYHQKDEKHKVGCRQIIRSTTEGEKSWKELSTIMKDTSDLGRCDAYNKRTKATYTMGVQL